MNRRRLLKFFALPSLLGAVGAGAFAHRARAGNLYYDGPVSGHFDGTRFFLPGQTRDKTQAELWKWRMAGGKAVWPAVFPALRQDTPPPRVTGRGLRVTLVGHASFLIQTGGMNLLVDPVWSERASPVTFAGPKRVNAPGIAFEALPAIDHVLVTHNHYDHMDVETLRRLGAHPSARILVPLGNRRILNDAGVTLPVTERDWGEHEVLGRDITAHLIPAKHWSARGLFDRRHALWAGFVLETPAGIVHIAGDTAYHRPVFADVKTRFGAPRLSLLPIGAYEPRWFMREQHMGPDEAVEAMLDCGAEAAIGYHWGTFQLTDEPITAPAEELATTLAAKSIPASRFRAFRPGEVWQG